MSAKLLIICALVSVFSSVSANVHILNERWEGDEFLFSACNVTGLSEEPFRKEVTFYFLNVNVTMIEVHYDPEWDMIFWNDFQYYGGINMGVEYSNTTQLSVYINVYGFPETDTSNVTEPLVNVPIYRLVNPNRNLEN